MRRTERSSGGVGDLDGFPGLRAVSIRDVAREDPGVAGGDACGGFPGDADFSHEAAPAGAIEKKGASKTRMWGRLAGRQPAGRLSIGPRGD
jgi:hypothetical protein